MLTLQHQQINIRNNFFAESARREDTSLYLLTRAAAKQSAYAKCQQKIFVEKISSISTAAGRNRKPESCRVSIDRIFSESTKSPRELQRKHN